MYTTNIDPKLNKTEFYKELLTQVNLIIDGERNWVSINRILLSSLKLVFLKKQLNCTWFHSNSYDKVTNLANLSSIIFHGMNGMDIFKGKRINWVGFYTTDKRNPESLVLGPFQGKVEQSCPSVNHQGTKELVDYRKIPF